MNAKKMREFTVQAKVEAAQRKKTEKFKEKIKNQKAEVARKNWWNKEGIPEILDKIQSAAKQGINFYEEVIDCCPDYVVESLEKEGFKVECTSEKRGVRLGRGDGDSWERYYAHVLKVSW